MFVPYLLVSACRTVQESLQQFLWDEIEMRNKNRDQTSQWMNYFLYTHTRIETYGGQLRYIGYRIVKKRNYIQQCLVKDGEQYKIWCIALLHSIGLPKSFLTTCIRWQIPQIAIEDAANPHQRVIFCGHPFVYVMVHFSTSTVPPPPGEKYNLKQNVCICTRLVFWMSPKTQRLDGLIWLSMAAA